MTVALPTAAPAGSFTVPEMAPVVVVWAWMAAGASAAAARASRISALRGRVANIWLSSNNRTEGWILPGTQGTVDRTSDRPDRAGPLTGLCSTSQFSLAERDQREVNSGAREGRFWRTEISIRSGGGAPAR